MSTVETAIDPRIHDRRAAVARAESQRRRRFLAVAVTPVLVGLVAWGVTFTPLLDVDHVQVRGATVTDAERVIAISGITTDAPMTGIDEAALAERIEALPWVADADVRREWPGTVQVDIIERVAALTLVRPDGGVAVLDGDGRVLSVQEEADSALLAAQGAASNAAVGSFEQGPAAELAAVGAAIGETLRPQIASIEHGEDGIALVLAAGGRVLVGSSEAAAEKVAAAAAVLAVVRPDCVDRLDVTIPSAPALVRLPSC